MFAITLLISVAGASTLNDVPADWHLDAPRTEFAQLVVADDQAADEPVDARYRITLTEVSAPTSKDRAFADDGKRCGLMGPPVCPSSGRAILRSGEDPITTITGDRGR